MTQADVTAALSGLGSYPTRCDAAEIVAEYLSVAAERAHWWERQVLKMHRGYVRHWQRMHCRKRLSVGAAEGEGTV